MPFLNADGTINVGQMVADAQKGGGSKLPDGMYTSRLLSVELSDARGANKVELPGKKRLNAKFTILAGEHEKEELYVSYNLFNKSERVGSTSGTVRFLTDLESIGEGVAKQTGIKLVFDPNGNMSVLTKTGPSVEALKALWAKAFAGKAVTISSETQTINSKPGEPAGAEFSLRRVTGLVGGSSAAVESDEELPDAPSDDEAPF